MSATFHVKQSITKAKKPPKKIAANRKVTNTYKRQYNLSKQMANFMTIDLIKGITTFKKKIKPEALKAAWQAGDYTKVINHIPWDKLPEDFEPAFGDVKTAAHKGGLIQLEALPPNINANLRFDLSNPRIERYMNTRAGEMIKYVGDDAKATVRMAVQESFSKALTPREVASRIKGSIGLLPRHVTAVANFRDSLIAEGRAPAQVEKLAAAYEARLLDYRLRMIARTETRLAVNYGQLSVWREGIAQGLIDPATAGKRWVVDGNPCDTCTAMDGVVVGIDDAWIIEYEDGTTLAVDVPTEAHPHCYCGMELIFGADDEQT